MVMSAGRKQRRLGRLTIGLTVFLVIITTGVVTLQLLMPPRIAALVASQLETRYGGKPTVTLEAVPIWLLASGRFTQLTLHYRQLQAGPGETIPDLSIDWHRGQVDVPALLRGQLKLISQGSATVRVALSLRDLQKNLPASVKSFRPNVSLEPGGLVVAGTASYAGVSVALKLDGRLAVTQNGQAVAFVPTRLTADGYPMPVPPGRTVFSLHNLALPQGARLAIQHVQVAKNGISILLVTVPH